MSEEYFGQLAIILYAVHLAPHLYEVAAAVYKIIRQVGVQQAKFSIGLVHNMLAVEISHLMLHHGFIHPPVPHEHTGICGEHYYFTTGILCLYGLAYGRGHNAFTYAASYLQDYFHFFGIGV